MAFKFNPVPNKFKPRVGQTYRFIGVPASATGNLHFLIGRRVWDGGKSDQARLAVNNVFETIKEAKTTRAKLVQVMKDAQATARRW